MAQRLTFLFIFFVIILLTPAKSLFAKDLCLQLKWFHQAQFAGFYYAEQSGFFSSKGLNIKFVEGGPKVNWQEQFKDTDCQIGITNAYEIVIARSKGIPVKAVAAINQISPIVWFSLKNSGIKNPRQFRGKNVVLVPTGKIQLRGMLKKVGMSETEMMLQPFSIDMSKLYRGEVDVWSGYHTNLVTKAEVEGYPVNVIHPIDYGVQIYDDVIYATEELIENSPDIVNKFLTASLKGWEEAVKNPAQAVSATLKYMKTPNETHQKGLFRRTIPYVHTGEVPIGWMEKDIWHEICALTQEVGLVDKRLSADEVFTDQFLTEIYHPSR
jgi:NitT/TauT family transport system substrate-binding protein